MEPGEPAEHSYNGVRVRALLRVRARGPTRGAGHQGRQATDFRHQHRPDDRGGGRSHGGGLGHGAHSRQVKRVISTPGRWRRRWPLTQRRLSHGAHSRRVEKQQWVAATWPMSGHSHGEVWTMALTAGIWKTLGFLIFSSSTQDFSPGYRYDFMAYESQVGLDN